MRLVYAYQSVAELHEEAESLVREYMKQSTTGFLNPDKYYIAKIDESQNNIDVVLAEIYEAAIYSNHYDGLVVFDVTNVSLNNSSVTMRKVVDFIRNDLDYPKFLFAFDSRSKTRESQVSDFIRKHFEIENMIESEVPLC